MYRKVSSQLILKPFFVVVISLVFFVTGRVSADQPRMRAALSALNTARNELQLASSNKGGHRRKALDLVNQAIIEVKKGIEYAQ